MNWLESFVRESNAIEGLGPDHDAQALWTSEQFLAAEELPFRNLYEAADALAGARLRDQVGLDVVVGSHRPPPGGPGIRTQLERLLVVVRRGWAHSGSSAAPKTVFARHATFEDLHPFMDGNGRVGRLVWAWEMCRGHGGDGFFAAHGGWRDAGFLHTWYYQSLQEPRCATAR